MEHLSVQVKAYSSLTRNEKVASSILAGGSTTPTSLPGEVGFSVPLIPHVGETGA